MIGKFNDVTALEKSYESLEKEFTKKCQELSAIKKQMMQSAETVDESETTNKNAENAESIVKNENNDTQNVDIIQGDVIATSVLGDDTISDCDGALDDTLTVNSSNLVESNNSSIGSISDGLEKVSSVGDTISSGSEDDGFKSNKENNSDKFEFNSLDFRTRAGEFLASNPEAREYAKEMSKILLTDKSLFNTTDPFKLAFALAKVNNLAGVSVKKESETAKPSSNSLNIEASEPMGDSSPVAILTSKMVGNAPAGARSVYNSLSEASESLLRQLKN